MSANITINQNNEAEVFSADGKPMWHGLGQIVNGLATAREAIHHARMDWKAEERPVFVDGKQVPDKKAIVRADNGNVLEILGKRYNIIQNDEAFDFFDEVVGAGQAIYDTAGTLGGGKRIWIMAKLKGSLFIDSRPNDTIDKNVLLVSSHDGSCSLWMQIVSTRVVCQNTLNIALAEATNQIKVRHTKNYKAKKDEAMKALNLCTAYFDNLQGVINHLDKMEMNQDEMVKFSEILVPAKEEKETVRANNIRNEIVTLFSRGKGNLGKSRWDALNAVTEYVDWHRSTRTSGDISEQEGRFNSSLFGSGNALKAKAFELLTA